ncbi:hypothetical protein OVA26_15080 [Microbacterium sp. SL62]|uniref:hypothetical protein n=1 Tax=Microbacterium sp. SL62 TaxID=2995139 RepID=UPI002275FF20|nr:hypothetical protein [Microbacterium sp. SL62]MCY1718259.1 hypothetical protein [Microbacterium sp. SL62]
MDTKTGGKSPVGVVELDDAEMMMISGGTTVPCGIGGAIVASINWCTNDTVLWGSCRLGTRGCC